MEVNRIYNENCLETMARMPDGFIDLTVTSPPYDNLSSKQTIRAISGTGDTILSEEKKCNECGKETTMLTKDGLCFACLAKKHEEPDDNEGTWFNKG